MRHTTNKERTVNKHSKHGAKRNQTNNRENLNKMTLVTLYNITYFFHPEKIIYDLRFSLGHM